MDPLMLFHYFTFGIVIYMSIFEDAASTQTLTYYKDDDEE